ncbi:MAG: aminotransferase class I/II-fold pyridoxal phosphate-dependent enzyme, partial [Bacteroidaceae bacterium]|nr:aminotransferase class I/II-fold pyridoxal phosphate-dependent enzyme [Bacteroidaceae bacterium]
FDPSYPAFIYNTVMSGRAGLKMEDGRWSNLVYLPCNAENNFVPSIPKERLDVVYLSLPNNPTGNDIDSNEIEKVINGFDGLVVIDEAYSDFSTAKSFRHELEKYPNIIVLNTMSKAYGAAAIRLGMAFAHPDIINIFNKVKYPYNINLLTQQKALELLTDSFQLSEWVKTILHERAKIIEALKILPICVHLYPTSANFVLMKVTDAQGIYDYLVDNGIIVRNRNKVALCANCLRITIGSKSENEELLKALRNYK